MYEIREHGKILGGERGKARKGNIEERKREKNRTLREKGGGKSAILQRWKRIMGGLMKSGKMCVC